MTTIILSILAIIAVLWIVKKLFKLTILALIIGFIASVVVVGLYFGLTLPY